MKRLNLMLHCGANHVERQEVLDTPTPAPTKTWHPIPHSRLINLMTERLPSYGMEVVQEAHGMFKGGDRYFGMFQVAPKREPVKSWGGALARAGGDGASLTDDRDFGLVFGLRNSHDKTFPAGLCLGSGVFVCDNLSFSAEIVIGRRHTRFINRDLPQLVSTAFGKLMQARIDQTKRLDTYKQTELTDTQAHDLIVQGLRAEAINTTRLPKVVEQWHTPAHPEFKEKTAWRLFNAFTEVYKDTSLVELPKRSTRLHGLLDSACGLQTEASAKTDLAGAFAENEDVTIAIR